MRAPRFLKSAALWAILTCAFTSLLAPAAHAANIVINNINAAGVGFNDATPRAPVGGNPGTTLGAQRLYIFNYAASIWGSILPDNVTITIDARFLAQTCTATSATLGSTSSNTSHRDFAGAPVAGHWYKQSLANKLFGSDLSASNDMTITFNLNIDSGCFGPGQVWYYGTDGNEGTNIELLPVVLHEIGHGLGFATLTSGSTGNYASSFPDIYDKFLLDKTTNTHWDSNTAAQRQASAIALDKLVWDGANAVSYATKYLTVGQPEVLANSPGAIAGSLYTAQDATFGAAITTSGFTGNVVLLVDNNGGGVGSTNPNDGCDPITNGAQLAGNIALIDRGVCTFAVKCKAAQDAGATGVIIVNNVAAGLPGMGGTDPTITIPCVGISQADGNAIKAQLANGVNVTIRRSPTVHAGADAANRPKMYTPNPFASGSSVSHWDISLTPNALMEPAINVDLHDSVDMTSSLLRDIGWFTTGGNIVGSQSTSTVICPTNPCVSLPVNIERTDTTPLLGYSVTFKLSSNLSLCAGTSSITEGTYLSSVGGTTFQVVNNGGGSYTVDGVLLNNCGATASSGNLFNVGVTSSAAGGMGQLTVTSVLLRDCNNAALPVSPGNIGGVPIDNQAPVVTVTAPNGGEQWTIGSTHNITWTATDNVAVANVDIAYSTDGGATYPNVIATAIPNSGSFAWTVPNTPTTQARVQVTAHDTGCSSGSDASDADFTIRDPIITATAGPGGSINPNGPVSVPSGTNQTFTITPADKCHFIADVKVDGVSVGPVSTYTFMNVIVDHTIDATFGTSGPFTITASAGAGGSITPSGPVLVACGASQKFDIAADDKCHFIQDVLVDGVSVGPVATYTFTDVQANHTIDASFGTYGPFSINATAGPGGSISPSGKVYVDCGASQTFDIAPDGKCHFIQDVLVDGVSVGPVASYTFTDVQADHTIDASFGTYGPFTISASAGPGGTISPDGSVVVPCGGDQTFVISPDKCHTIADVVVDGSSVGPVSSYTFTDVQADHTISATFNEKPALTITATAGPGGSISPSGAVVVPCGGSQTFTITPNAGYAIADVKVDGSSVGPVASYTFTDVQSDHTIDATFNDVQGPSVTVISPNGGETLVVGGVFKMSWSATDNSGTVTDVDLYISRDNGATWEKIASGIPNSGTYTWTVTGPGTNTGPDPVFSALFRVDARDGSSNVGTDASDAPFAIYDIATATTLSMFQASAIGDAIELRWQLGDAHFFSSFALERSESEAGPWFEQSLENHEEQGVVVALDRSVEPEHTYFYRLIGVTPAAQRVVLGQLSGSIHMRITELALGKIVPNPSHALMRIEYALPRETSVKVSVVDLQGRQVALLVNGVFRAGRYQTTWTGQTDRGTAAPAGIYFVRCQALGKNLTQRIVRTH
jgi:hypothetical protein